MLDFLVLVLFPFGMAFAAASDLTTMTISNRLQVVLLAGFMVAAALVGMDLATFGMHVGAGLLVLVVAFGCFAFGWIGGGDAKLAAVTALWFGFGLPLAEYLVTSAFFGGILTLLILFARAKPLPTVLAGQSWAVRLHDEKSGIPYGIALAGAALSVYPNTFWMTAAIGS